MSPALPPIQTTPPDRAGARVHWIVRLNWRNRSVFFLPLGVAFGLHLADIGAGWLAWALLLAQCLIHPHLLYLRAARHHDLTRQARAELENVLIDTVCFTLWCMALGFPLWITFILGVESSYNLVALMGLRGVLFNAAAMAAGCVLGSWWFWPIAWHLQTSLRTTLAFMLVFIAYILVFARDGYMRARRLVEKSEQLKAQLAANRVLQTRLHELARRDPLTDLHNRRHLDEVLPAAFSRCQREGHPLALVMIDIDHFKVINDTWGHFAGDEVLKALAHVLQTQTRLGDLACRIGGEEFVLVMENTPLQGAIQRAEMLRLTFAALRVMHGDDTLSATLSCGLAVFPEHASTAPALLEAADHALYAAKQAGRDQTSVAAASVLRDQG